MRLISVVNGVTTTGNEYNGDSDRSDPGNIEETIHLLEAGEFETES